jgi:hypothetical protein
MIPSESQSSSVKEVLATEKAWVQAHLDLDLKVLDRVLADEYLAVGSQGEIIDKTQTLASYGSGERHWEVAEGDEYLVHLYNETAVVYGRWRGVGINHGQPFNYMARFISVYVHQEGRWQMVSAQSTPIVNQLETGK